MFLQFFTSCRGPGYRYPIGTVQPVPDDQAQKFITARAAKKVPAPAGATAGELATAAGIDLDAICERQAKAKGD